MRVSVLKASKRKLVDVRQLSFSFGVIKLDKTLRLDNAHHVKQWECSKAGSGLVDELLTGLSAKYERFHYNKYFDALSCLLANLFFAAKHGKRVLFGSRGRRTGDHVVQNALIEHLAEERLIDLKVQPANSHNTASYMIPLPELTHRLEIHKIRIARKGNTNPMRIRDRDGKEKSLSRFIIRNKQEYARITKGVELHNSYWGNNRVTVDKKPVIPFLTRSFNINTTLGGRFYGSYLSMPKGDRDRILFNGKQTVELDYSSLHIAILYAWAGVEMIGDPYTIKGFDRKLVKAIFLRFVNSNNLSGFKANITNSSKPKRKEQYERYKHERMIFEMRASKGLAATAPKKPVWLDSHITGIPTGFNTRLFVDELLKRHSAIAHLLGTENIGLKLQYADSELMNGLLVDLYNRKNPTPCLPVHDSLVCRKTNLELVRLTMLHHFKAMFNAKITIK